MILDSSKVTFLISQTIQSYVHRNSLVRFLGQLCTYSPRPCSTSFSIASELGTMALHIHSEYANFIESILKLVHLIVNWMLLHSSPYIYTTGSKCSIEFHEKFFRWFLLAKCIYFSFRCTMVRQKDRPFTQPDMKRLNLTNLMWFSACFTKYFNM